MKGIFIAGTDTGVGKSIVTGCLGRFLLKRGYDVITQKWVQTGSGANSFSPDVKLHLEIMGRKKSEIKEYLAQVAPYVFRQACSPHLACESENKKIERRKIIKSFKLLSDKFDFVLAEGSGGLLVPFNRRHFLIDIAKELDLAVLLVAQNKLGAVNHTLLAVEALRQRKMKLLGIVFNNPGRENSRILKDNPRIIRGLSKERTFGVLPWRKTRDNLYAGFIPIAQKIEKALRYG